MEKKRGKGGQESKNQRHTDRPKKDWRMVLKIVKKDRQRGNEGWWLGEGLSKKNNSRWNEKQEKLMNWGCLNQG